jgi:hypothetical protein
MSLVLPLAMIFNLLTGESNEGVVIGVKHDERRFNADGILSKVLLFIVVVAAMAVAVAVDDDANFFVKRDEFESSVNDFVRNDGERLRLIVDERSK